MVLSENQTVISKILTNSVLTPLLSIRAYQTISKPYCTKNDIMRSIEVNPAYLFMLNGCHMGHMNHQLCLSDYK